ncbi:MAG: DUF305 domain-containing protein [Bosea sp. (in: a-proteobacteria)]|uniref:CopM family metallochaperone n=1 Tax=Bosea sp. (in: a-proteobacteria) TaxID=1871050 RepID=UPI002733EB6E|nr:DUF305 domain-containing protein [Bosea sp. (in: a-proteobacteria)]MDP3256188.1 DUF305 domain-containing protein [Bosea sp. (in: a-proteobacteria)]MDP3319472.1 DUF305 domain-containing protein [Bosea sp. (in: a-proteobacteria)]
MLPAGLAILLAGSLPAQAHVKWFAPYIVGAPPQPIGATLSNVWFWSAITLVLMFFLAARAIERSPAGETILSMMDKITDPVWQRLDEFVRLVISAFFVAIFAVGGVYLTPDLKTPAEWVSWVQLVIAALVIPRATRPAAAAGIIGLWLLALRDYDIFHLLDYLSLGAGVAAYLVLESSNNAEWRKYRFEALRIGVAIALMWSSLEKFAYPSWFDPIVDEKPFLTFGLPPDVFIPMAGVAEFTLGFGMIWTPLVRRLSAIALFFVFNAAVFPFGRIDLIGHALIMAIIVAIACDHTRGTLFLSALKSRLAAIPAGLATALVIFAGGYWGLHIAIYGPAGRIGPPTSEIATHSHSPEYPHGPRADGGIGAPPRQDTPSTSHATHAAGPSAPAATATGSALAAYQQALERMHGPMMQGITHADPDVAFVLGMIPHHQGAIDMAEIQLRYGRDEANRKLAAAIIAAQKPEIADMRGWLRQRNLLQPSGP